MQTPCFEVVYQPQGLKARLGIIKNSYEDIETPAFFPVATQATVKGIAPWELNECQIKGLLCNAYHLYLRPGPEIIRNLGGLHRFMGWDKLIITDSGGYQIFSLSVPRKVGISGVEFQSPVDGSKHFLSPEQIMEIQFSLGSDIVLPLDECLRYPVDSSEAKQSLEITSYWAEVSVQAFLRLKERYRREPLFLGIVQGSTYFELRKQAIERLLSLGFKDFALGGLSVGEPGILRYNIIDFLVENLPPSSLRYLMGVGKPEDILEAVEKGVDLFDCIIPTRLGRTGTVFTNRGKVIIRNASYKEQDSPLDEECACAVCQRFSRGYLRHLINAKEMLGARLLSYHNLYWFSNFLKGIRQSIKKGEFPKFKETFLKRYRGDED